MKICIIGHTGFVGQSVYNYLINKCDIYGVNSKTKTIPTKEFDIVINCAGNAKKYMANKDAAKDFYINTNIFHTILKIKMKQFIHISSIDAAYTSNDNYTISKLILEKCSKLYFPESVIIRIGGIVGPNLKKNVVFDIINNKNLFVTFNSIYNYISTKEIAKIIKKIIDLNIKNEIINIAALKPISVKEIIEEAQKKSIFFTKSQGNIKENYKKINIKNLNKFFHVKTSHHYIKEYFNNLTN